MSRIDERIANYLEQEVSEKYQANMEDTKLAEDNVAIAVMSPKGLEKILQESMRSLQVKKTSSTERCICLTVSMDGVDVDVELPISTKSINVKAK